MKIIKPNIFPANIIAGVTEKNIEKYPEFGFSIYDTGYIEQSYIQNCLSQLADTLNINVDKIIKQKQIHTDNIVFINNQNYSGESDAMFTNKTTYCLSVSIADCVAILIYDKKNNIISAVHSGWKGTKLNIIGKTINKLQEQFNSKAEDLLFYISPSASVDNYEVGDEFLYFFPGYVISKNGKYFFDNKSAVLDQILSLNIDPSQIEISDLDTISNENLHSFRRDKTKSGRMAAFIMIKNV